MVFVQFSIIFEKLIFEVLEHIVKEYRRDNPQVTCADSLYTNAQYDQTVTFGAKNVRFLIRSL
jgi:hypothetical protein